MNNVIARMTRLFGLVSLFSGFVMGLLGPWGLEPATGTWFEWVVRSLLMACACFLCSLAFEEPS